MRRAALVDRLSTLEAIADLPRAELEWLARRGRYVALRPGDVIGPKDEPLRTMWVILSGTIAIRVDRGAGPKRVMEWRAGDVSGKLPYSRMTGPPGDNYAAEPTEVLILKDDDFPELMRECPAFTALTVHLMLDRARSFTASALQDEKMISLGKLSAGLAHELNNPASATVRSAKLLSASLANLDAAARGLEAAGLSGAAIESIEAVMKACLGTPYGSVLSPIEQAEREDAISDWLADRQIDTAHAAPLADTPITIEALDSIAAIIPEGALGATVGWMAAECTTHALAREIEEAATRIHDLVGAVKRFTFMDQLAGPEAADVEPGLRDTIAVLAAKAKGKGAGITVQIEPGLPKVRAAGGELNQVWMNLIDNALDAIDDAGRVDITARHELDRVVVRIVDDGAGIPAKVLPRIFDPFFTTKPPGQGTGLGLEIARQLVRRYDGDITVRSRPGRTEFAVSMVAVDG